MNPKRRKLLYRLGAAKQEVAATVTSVVQEVKPVPVEVKEALPVVEEIATAQDTVEVVQVQEEVAVEITTPVAGKKSKKSV
jgi:hypothetical protein